MTKDEEAKLDALSKHLGYDYTQSPRQHPYITCIGNGSIDGVSGFIVYAFNMRLAKQHVPKEWDGVKVHLKKMGKPKPAKRGKRGNSASA